ncbi:MAG: secretion protein, partial [Paramuribaculum sp.]|nr:secretion protein [Paramuribaculum sp.]
MKNSLLLGAVLGVAAIPMQAQKITGEYLTWPNTFHLSNYVSQWNGGNGKLTIENQTWEDEEFFISRVKPHYRFIDRNTQVYSTINDDNDKRCVYWVPIGDCPNGQFNSNAFPAGSMDGEVFSMWSYVDHYGDWTSPFGWVPGVFADVAHKNGVAVSGVAGTPFGGISAEWKSAYQALGSTDKNALGKFLLYHGVDGVGYNSEWSGYAPTELISMHNALKTYMADKNPLWEVIWYAGTTDGGSCSFDKGVGTGGSNTQLFQGASMFLNYNWNNTSTMQNSISYAKSVNRSPFFIYAGMNMQGGEPKSGDNYPILKDYQYSIGLWGAHNFNMFWESRNGKGSAPATMQRTYINNIENFFGNAPRNPAIRKTIKTNRGHRALSDWAGLSSMMSARSALSWSIADEPFITYFNLGNGSFFNWRGERVSDNEWYNIGLQDYLPTWRWWFAPKPLNGNISESDVNLSADFVWDDAFMGGSCLQIAGSTTEEYLHLFKTNFTVAQNQVLRLTFKLLEGEGDVALMLGKGGDGAASAAPKYKSVFTVAKSAETLDKSYENENNGWQTYEWKLGSADITTLKTGVGYIGL